MNPKRFTNRRSTAVVVFAVLLLLASAGAQINSGSVIGVITDQSGAVVAGAQVTLANVGMGSSVSATTDQAGQYSFPNVPVGRYEVNVARHGFKKQVQSAFAVHAMEVVRVNFSLAVGEVAEQVTVTAAVTTVNTESASEGNTVTGRQVNELPLTTRLFTQLVMLEPGVSAPIEQSPGFGSNSSANFSVNGTRTGQNNLMVDGVRNVDTFGGNAFVSPNLFAISEFRIESNAYTATAGRSAGGQINVISRSGTNQFHGNVFEFFRNDALNARNYFATQLPKNRYNDFGYDFGGPIKKDKLFFFWSQEWRRIIQSGGTSQAVVPTAAERKGDFSAAAGTIIDPLTGLPFPGNVIPTSRIDPNALLLLNTYFPAPTINGYNDLGMNYVSSKPDFTRWREDSIRVDANLTNKLSMYGRFTQDAVKLENPFGMWRENSLADIGGSSQEYPIYNTSVHLTWTPKPTFISEISWGLYYGNDKYLNNGPLSDRARAKGLNIAEVFPMNELNRIPNLSFGWSNVTNHSIAPIQEWWAFHNSSFSMPVAVDNTWTKGKHTFRFGGTFTPEGKSEASNGGPNNTNGSFYFSGEYTGDPVADMLLGRAASYSETAVNPYGKYRWYNFEPYFEDQIKLRPNLTLTAGLRWEYFSSEHEQENMLGTFNPALYNSIKAPTVNPDGTLVAGTGDPLNGIIMAGVNSPYGDSVFPSHKNGFAPRVGIAWDPTGTGKTSIRAGYGIFYDRWGSFSQFSTQNPPFNNSVSIYNTTLSNPGGAPGTSYPAGLTAAMGPWKYPYVQKWSLSIQREVAANTTASIAYVATKGTHLLGKYDLNQPYANTQVAAGTSANALRPYKGYSGITAWTTSFGSNYNSLQASVIRRMDHGLSLQAAYTYSKAITDMSGEWNAAPQDSRNFKAEKGLADFDLTHVLTFNYTWDIPFFHSFNGVQKSILDGWQLSGITKMQSGNPLTIFVSGDFAGTGAWWGQRANLIGDPKGPKTMSQWFNTAAFANPAVGTFGDSPKGVVRGPGLQNWDMAVSKTFPLREAWDLKFRAQAFNVFNHPNWGYVDTTYYEGSPTFGKVTGMLSPRIMQMSLALTF